MFLIKTFIFISVLFSTSCSSWLNRNHTERKADKIPVGQISEEVAIDLMRRSFFVGCLKAFHSQGKKGVAGICQKMAREHSDEIRAIVQSADLTKP